MRHQPARGVAAAHSTQFTARIHPTTRRHTQPILVWRDTRPETPPLDKARQGGRQGLEGCRRSPTLVTPCSLPAHVDRRKQADEIRDLDSGQTLNVRHLASPRRHASTNQHAHAKTYTRGSKVTGMRAHTRAAMCVCACVSAARAVKVTARSSILRVTFTHDVLDNVCHLGSPLPLPPPPAPLPSPLT